MACKSVWLNNSRLLLIAPDVGVSDQLAHLFFGQLIAGMVSPNIQPPRIHLVDPNPMTAIHPSTRNLSSRSQAREPATERCYYPQNLGFRPLVRIQTQDGPDENAIREVWQSAIRCTRGMLSYRLLSLRFSGMYQRDSSRLIA